MARTIGPLFSLDAEGSVGNALTYSKWKGRNLVKSKVDPSNPSTLAQRQARLAITILNSLWRAADPVDLEEWAPLAQAKNYTKFNAMTSENIQREAQGLGPLQLPSGGPSYSDPPLLDIEIAGGQGTITWSANADGGWAAEDRLALCIRPSTAGGNVPWKYHIAALQPGGTDTFSDVVTSIEPGNYEATIYGFAGNGEILVLTTTDPVVVT